MSPAQLESFINYCVNIADNANERQDNAEFEILDVLFKQSGATASVGIQGHIQSKFSAEEQRLYHEPGGWLAMRNSERE
jgi:hypothetical protein